MKDLTASQLVVGKEYRIREDRVRLVVSPNVLQYSYQQTYQGVVRYNFYDAKTRLFHWLEPYEVMEA